MRGSSCPATDIRCDQLKLGGTVDVLVDAGRIGEDRAEQRQRQAQAAQDDVFPGRFEGGVAVVQRHQQHRGQRGGLQREPHHAQVVGQHHQEHAGGEQRREHEELLHPPGRDHSRRQVAPKIAPRVERGPQRHHRDQQHHPRAQGVGPEELLPLRHDVRRRLHPQQQLHPERDRDAEGQHVQRTP